MFKFFLKLNILGQLWAFGPVSCKFLKCFHKLNNLDIVHKLSGTFGKMRAWRVCTEVLDLIWLVWLLQEQFISGVTLQLKRASTAVFLGLIGILLLFMFCQLLLQVGLICPIWKLLIKISYLTGFISSCATNPIWLIKTRLQLDRSQSNLTSVIRRIHAEGGVKSFWKGLTASWWGISETVIHFVIYEFLKKCLAERQNKKKDAEKNILDFVGFMACGATSKTCATCVAYPHGIVLWEWILHF